jgi:hypothetical protein
MILRVTPNTMHLKEILPLSTSSLEKLQLLVRHYSMKFEIEFTILSTKELLFKNMKRQEE